jgi:hypothetical protein
MVAPLFVVALIWDKYADSPRSNPSDELLQARVFNSFLEADRWNDVCDNGAGNGHPRVDGKNDPDAWIGSSRTCAIGISSLPSCLSFRNHELLGPVGWFFWLWISMLDNWICAIRKTHSVLPCVLR